MTIFIPAPLRSFAGGRGNVDVHAATISEALNGLTEGRPELRHHLFTGEGKLRAFVNLYLNGDDVRYLPAREATAVRSTDILSIIPSIAGGCLTGNQQTGAKALVHSCGLRHTSASLSAG